MTDIKATHLYNLDLYYHSRGIVTNDSRHISPGEFTCCDCMFQFSMGNTRVANQKTYRLGLRPYQESGIRNILFRSTNITNEFKNSYIKRNEGQGDSSSMHTSNIRGLLVGWCISYNTFPLKMSVGDQLLSVSHFSVILIF